MWCVKFTFETNLTEISQNVRFPHFPLFQILAHLQYFETNILVHIGHRQYRSGAPIFYLYGDSNIGVFLVKLDTSGSAQLYWV